MAREATKDTSEVAALRDFDPAYVAEGSWSCKNVLPEDVRTARTGEAVFATSWNRDSCSLQDPRSITSGASPYWPFASLAWVSVMSRLA
jgi:hypothetical protein